jgi:drug/metabolite transporter (DMT)-like permease
MVLLCALWGLQQVAVKVAVGGGLPPLLLGAFRSVVAAGLVVLWTGWRGGASEVRALLAADRSLIPGMTLGAIFTAEFAVLYPGLALTSASRGVLFLYTAPFFTALGAHVLLPGERLTRRTSLGLAIAFGGVAVAFADGLLKGQGSLAGDALCLLGALLWAVSTMRIKSSPDLGRARAAKVLLYQLGVSAPFLFALSAAVGEWHGLVVSVRHRRVRQLSRVVLAGAGLPREPARAVHLPHPGVRHRLWRPAAGRADRLDLAGGRGGGRGRPLVAERAALTTRLADRRELIRHAGEHFRDMADLHLAAFAGQPSGHIQQTPHVARQQQIGPGCGDVAGLV